VIAVILAVAAGLVAANMLGVAAAEAPTTTPVRTVSVQGVATVPLAQGADVAVATAAYRQGMAAAIADGKVKAEYLAGKVEATLGSAQSVVEDGGSIGCTRKEESPELESRYAEYEGEQPDFGYGTSTAPRVEAAAPRVASGARPPKKAKKKKRPTARKSSAVTCTLSTQVSLIYALV